MAEDTSGAVTVLLRRASDGDRPAMDRLFRIVHRELRAIAQKQMRGERADHSLQATVLIDDAFLRLLGEEANISFQDRKHFYRTASNAMYRMLIDHERGRRAQRRGGGEHQRVDFDVALVADTNRKLDLLALHEAMTRLAEQDPRQAEVVKLHHFGGLSLNETAEILEVSVSTIKTEWRMAKAWLRRELTRGTESESQK